MYLDFEVERVEFKTWKGLNRGDRIGMYAVNHYEWIVTQLAAAKAGLILGKDALNHKWLWLITYESYSMDHTVLAILYANQVHLALLVNRFNSHITVVSLNYILFEFV